MQAELGKRGKREPVAVRAHSLSLARDARTIAVPRRPYSTISPKGIVIVWSPLSFRALGAISTESFLPEKEMYVQLQSICNTGPHLPNLIDLS
jgi:hypothetical protein